MTFMTREAIASVGFRSVGRDIQISDRAQFYNPAAISVGDCSRIDDFCLLSAGTGGITIGRHVHIACFSIIVGDAAVTLEDFSGLSSRVAVYSSTEDVSGEWLTNPTVPGHLRRPKSGPVHIRRHAILGSGSVVLPEVNIGTGAVVGALTLVARDLEEFTVYLGVPARRIGVRKRDLLTHESGLAAD